MARSRVPLHFTFLLSGTPNYLLPLCRSVASHESDGSWKHPHVFSTPSLEDNTLSLSGPHRVHNKQPGFNVVICKLEAGTLKVDLQSHSADRFERQARRSQGKGETSFLPSCCVSSTRSNKGKPPWCCSGRPTEPYLMTPPKITRGGHTAFP